ncbi:GGDEF domain-containing protein [Ruminococcus albus]|uniref:Diguanylate cyclase (GGDEF) domain-containing protein n=1 Tax=Ruminococcus albus TaxID=1264 RepID=A0A1I1D0D7_RUMAL|nr:GGDEF domain-containing protein [Ruminococcus albus]SFB66608.1 diguanylate cyclase (GGDEF) domain-containing protein [Ruminococcus albus]
MDLQAFVNKFKIIAGVYAFDILPDGSKSEIRIMAINDINTMMFNMLPDAPEFYPGVPLRRYFTEVNLENFIYNSAINNEPLYSYVNAFGMWIKGFYLPLDEDGNILNEKGEPNTSPRTAYCLYITTRSAEPETEYMTQRSGEVASAIMELSVKLNKMQSFEMAMKECISELNNICSSEYCALYTIDALKKECKLYNENGEQPEMLESMTSGMGRTPYETALAWEKDLDGTDCLLLDDLSIIEERDPVWYRSLKSFNVNKLILTAIRYDHDLVGFIWAINFDTEKTMEIKETLELTTFMLGARISHHHLVSRLEIMSRTDSLTQLLNRNAMNERVEQLTNDKSAKPECIGVVFADLNGLKAVNDGSGHAAGDKLLQNAAALLKIAFDEYEIYRSGGDEFVVLCPDITPEKLEESVARLHALAENTPNVSFATGAKWYKGDYDIFTAMQAADQSMYQNKEEFYRQHPEKNWRKNL